MRTGLRGDTPLEDAVVGGAAAGVAHRDDGVAAGGPALYRHGGVGEAAHGLEGVVDQIAHDRHQLRRRQGQGQILIERHRERDAPLVRRGGLAEQERRQRRLAPRTGDTVGELLARLTRLLDDVHRLLD